MATRNIIRISCVVLAVLFSCLAGAASAGSPNDAIRVADLQPGAPGSDPRDLTAVGEKVFFTAEAGGLGREVYVSDGTEAGTQLLKDIRPGSNVSSNPEGLTSHAGLLFFSADDGTDGSELWRSDGTTAGTVMVKDINPGVSLPSSPTNLTSLGGVLAFVADDGVAGRELWRSDGTEAGTEQVGDLNSAPGGSNPTELSRVGGQVYFSAIAASGTGLFRWEPGVTLALVQDISPSNGFDLLEQITDVNGVAYFRADNGSDGVELWRANPAGTSAAVVENLNAGAASGNPTGLTALGGKVYFQAFDGNPAVGRELYQADATGIDLVKDIANPGQGLPKSLTNVGGTLYFSAVDGDGEELWRSDGTGPGTTKVKDISPGPASSFPSDLRNVDGTLYFAASDPATGRERWRSDGSGAGTAPIEDIEAGSGDSAPPTTSPVVGAGGAMYLSASQTGSGFELWKYADTIAPTVTIDSGPSPGATISTGSPTFAFSSDDASSTFACRIYATGSAPPAFGACSAAVSHTPPSALANGSYTFDVRGTDIGENVGGASRSFIVAIPGPDGDSAACKKARSDLEAAQKRLDKAKASLKKAKKSKKAAKVKKAKAKLKKAKTAVKTANAAVADAC